MTDLIQRIEDMSAEEVDRLYDLYYAPQQNRTPEQSAELLKCSQDVCHWISNWCWTFDPFLRMSSDPFVKMELFPFQEDFIHWLEERESSQSDGFVEKSRDSGASYLFMAFLTHRWLFRNGWAGGVGSNKLESVDSIGDPKSLFQKMRIMLERLPEWMLPANFNLRRNIGLAKAINPANNSTIIGEGGDQIGRGGRTSIYGVDEAAYLERPHLADASLFQTTMVRIYISTPRGLEEFYKKRGRMAKFRMYWKDDPRKNKWYLDLGGNRQEGQGYGPDGAIYPWFETQKARESPETVAQEIEIDYIGTGSPCFARAYLMKYYDSLSLAGALIEKVGDSAWANDVTTFKQPVDGHEYLICSDVIEGLDPTGESDWNVSHVYDLDTWEQVAHLRGKSDTHGYAVDLAALGKMYNNALIAVERTGPGLSVIDNLMNVCLYDNIYVHQDFDDSGKALSSYKPGWPATVRSKKESVEHLKSIIRDMADYAVYDENGVLIRDTNAGFIWNHPNTVDELVHYVNLPGRKTGNEVGSHDDETTCARIGSVVVPMFTRRGKLERKRTQEFVPKVSNTSHIRDYAIPGPPRDWKDSLKGLGLE